MERFFVIQTDTGYTIGCEGHTMPLPFKYISAQYAYSDVHDLNTGKKTVAGMYYSSFVAGCRRLNEKPLKYSEWLEKNGKKFEHWYQ